MDTLLSSSAEAPLRLASRQALLCTARAGTWLQVQRGTLTVQATPRWLGGCMVAPARRLKAGEGMALDGGWWNLSAADGPVVCHCVATCEPSRERLSSALMWQRAFAFATRLVERLQVLPLGR